MGNVTQVEQERAAFEDGAWYWVEKEGWIGDPATIAPALYKAECDAWYSFEFSGIPTRELTVLEPCRRAWPVAVPLTEKQVRANKTIRLMNASSGLSIGMLMGIVRAIERAQQECAAASKPPELLQFNSPEFDGIKTAQAAAQKTPCKYGDQCLYGCNHIADAGQMVVAREDAVSVKLPESDAVTDSEGCIAWRVGAMFVADGRNPFEHLFTADTVRQLLAAQSNLVESHQIKKAPPPPPAPPAA